MADDATYIIQSGSAAAHRLDTLARVCWPSTEAFLRRQSFQPGQRFLDVGCGSGDVSTRVAPMGMKVTGIDVNPEVVAFATERAGDTADVEFRAAGIDDVGTPGLDGFDVVYTRCVLSHLPDPAAAMASLMSGVRPGGTLLIEDVEVGGVWSAPRHPAIDRYRELYVTAATASGASPWVAAEFGPMAASLGAIDVHVDMMLPVLREPGDQMIHALTMDAIAGPVLTHQLADTDEIAELVQQLTAFAHTPGNICTLPRMVQLTARRAG